jgi:hypothetical protein
MGILTWIVLGLVAGVIAKLVIPGNDPGGIILTIVLGVVGAVLGGFNCYGTGLRSDYRLRRPQRGNRNRGCPGLADRVSTHREKIDSMTIPTVNRRESGAPTRKK